MITLDEHFTIESETNGGCALVFRQKRIRTKKDETEEEYIFESADYFPTVKDCLIKYSDYYVRDAKDVKEVLEKIQKLENKINAISFSKI